MVWVGRTDYDVTVYDIASGKIDALFSTSEVQSSAEMLQAGGGGGDDVTIQSSSLRLFATAQGDLAMMDGGGADQDDADGGSVSWVAPSSLSSPIVTAIDPSTNHRIPVVTVEDNPDGEAGGVEGDMAVVKMLPGGDGIYALPVTSGAKGSKPKPGESSSKSFNKVLLNLGKKVGKPIETSLKPPSSAPLSSGGCSVKSQNYPDCLVGQSIFVEDKKVLGNGGGGAALDEFKQLQQFHDLYQVMQMGDKKRRDEEKVRLCEELNDQLR